MGWSSGEDYIPSKYFLPASRTFLIAHQQSSHGRTVRDHNRIHWKGDKMLSCKHVVSVLIASRFITDERDWIGKREGGEETMTRQVKRLPSSDSNVDDCDADDDDNDSDDDGDGDF
uniref:SWIM-type domain-containing protein n=1 Tax=Setaria digitata TaxID=48799 RepID=A0A915Q5E2_9BILA